MSSQKKIKSRTLGLLLTFFQVSSSQRTDLESEILKEPDVDAGGADGDQSDEQQLDVRAAEDPRRPSDPHRHAGRRVSSRWLRDAAVLLLGSDPGFKRRSLKKF